MYRHLLILIISACINNTALAQSKDFIFRNLTMEDGLPSNETYYVLRDSKNYLWFATDKGVVRYDGREMERFNLPDNVVFKMYEDSKGRVWFFSYTGKLSYWYNDRIYAYKYNAALSKQFSNILISSACVDEDDNIFLNSYLFYNYTISKNGRVDKYNYQQVKPEEEEYEIRQIGKNKWFLVNTVEAQQGESEFIRIKIPAAGISVRVEHPADMHHGQYGLLTLKNNGWILFCGNTLIHIGLDGNTRVKVLEHELLSAFLDSSENIYLGFHLEGAVKMDKNFNVLSHFNALSGKSISGISADFEGGIWFTTLENGVYYLKDEKINRISTDPRDHPHIFRICEPVGDTLIFGDSKGIFGLTKDNKQIPIIEEPVKSIYHLKRTDYGLSIGIRLPKNDTSVAKKVKVDKAGISKAIFSYSKNELIPLKNKGFLVSGSTSLVELKDIKLDKTGNFGNVNSYCSFSSNFAMQASNKTIWIGSNNGLFRYDEKNAIPVSVNQKDTLFAHGLTHMKEMENGLLMLGVRFGGIAIMKDTACIARITEAQGLLNNAVQYLLPVGNQLWVATVKGISVITFLSYTPLKYEIENIGKPEGLYNTIIYQLVLRKGEMLAVTSNGIYCIDDALNYVTKSQPILPFYIRNISSYKGDTNAIAKISLPYNQNRLSVKFSAITFNEAEDVVYAYRIKQTDTVWRTTSSNELVFENLSPGSYNLEIRAAIPGKKRVSAIQTLQITIEKPWWQYNITRLLFIFIIAVAFFLFYRYRIRLFQKKEIQKLELKNKMTELENMALRSQMNPHFIFNSLASIQHMIISGRSTEANDYLVKLSRLLRSTLELSENSYIRLSKEIHFLTEYMALEQLRSPGQFQFNITTGPGVDNESLLIPHMILQPIVENAIRHGVMPLENKVGMVSVRFNMVDQQLICEVIDNGVGYNQSLEKRTLVFNKHRSFGMDIVRKRLKILQDLRSGANSFSIKNVVDKEGRPSGTSVTMILPFKNNTE